MKRLLSLMAIMTVFVMSALGQRTVTGYVYSASDDQPVVGATVQVEGTTIGTATDLDGNFVLKNVPNSAKTLVVSYVGMQTQHVAVADNVRVGLKDMANDLDELIVVAYGTAKKSAYTGSASVVKAETIENSLVSNATDALNGKIAGVQIQSSNGQPGSAPSVRIRGVGSLSASNEPLYVVDGIPYDGNISDINTQDIESMTVLKDAAAAALYGARGANGVILITTKKGSLGQAKVTVDARWGQNHRAVPNYDV
ncbi:MAG: TonB-dependent receptor plug domain-containing protein, partial [Bacteroides sp.]|nr:TonB-dependent receptor plug domain-containing protein [Bacteroides sp.]